jgi:endonuclease I
MGSLRHIISPQSLQGTMYHFIRIIFVLSLFVCQSFVVWADYEIPNTAYAPPLTYYNGATGTGSVLKNNLKNIITSGYTGVSYGDARYAFAYLDRDPNNTSNILLVYNRASVSGSWDGGATYNREHVFCCSWLGIDTPSNSYVGVGSDLFNLRPCNSTINSTRSNTPFGSDASTGSYGQTGAYWYPGDADAGTIARNLFYMATRWADMGLTLTEVTGTPSYGSLQGGDLSSLLHWHYKHGVDNFERRRNDLIYDNYQHNRNPYVDHPEYVWAIFGGGNNNSRIYVGSTNPGDGVSMVDVSLGRVMKNGTIGTTTVTMNKTGAHPTTFDITPGGDITLSGGTSFLKMGEGQCMDYNAQTKSLLVGLSSSTSSTGLKNGSITINNTDLTSGGTGLGAADGNDIVNVSASVLDKRLVTPNTVSVNFGRVVVGANVAQSVNLSTTGDDNNRTRVNVSLAAVQDANGIGITGVGQVFNSASSIGTRNVGGVLNQLGPKSGSFSLAVTTAENGGAGITGEGTYTAIPLSYSATVLDHASPSFGNSPQNSLTIDFGIVEAGTGVHSTPFNIRNLATTSPYTAALDLDSIQGSGATSVMTTNLTTFSNLAAGDSTTYSSFFEVSTPGDYSATYSLGLSDENLIGASATGSQLLSLVVKGRALTRQWIHKSDGNWSNAANWVGAVPSGINSDANFKAEISSNTKVMLDSDQTVGRVIFDSPISYEIVGSNVLSIQSSESSAIHVYRGYHEIEAPIVLQNAVTIEIANSAELSLTNSLSNAYSSTITKCGPGTLHLKGFAALDSGSQIVILDGILKVGYSSSDDDLSRVNVMNNSKLNFLAGVHVLTTISGTGTTVVADSSNLTVSSLIQDSLQIGGAAMEGHPSISGNNAVPEPSSLLHLFLAIMIVSSLLLLNMNHNPSIFSSLGSEPGLHKQQYPVD